MVGDFSTFKDAIVNNICNIFCNECGVNVARELGNKNQDELIFEANLKKNLSLKTLIRSVFTIYKRVPNIVKLYLFYIISYL